MDTEDTETELQIVYILTNPSMPGLIKIGRTSNIATRLDSLTGASGVPDAFEVAYAAYVKNASGVESALHSAFSMHRLPGKEFFKLPAANVVAVLALVEVRAIDCRLNGRLGKSRTGRRSEPGRDVIRVLTEAKISLSASDLAKRMGVSRGEATKRWKEVAEHLSVGKVGKQLRIALKA